MVFLGDIRSGSEIVNEIATGEYQDILGCLSDCKFTKLFDLSDAVADLTTTVAAALSSGPEGFTKSLLSALGVGGFTASVINWGKADYWVWPNLFLKKSGDCEDYAIVKYFTLKELGMDTDKLRIVVLRDTRRLSHAVLAVYMDKDIVILDNISNAILPQGRLRHYVPQFSFNEKSRWAHMRGKKTNE